MKILYLIPARGGSKGLRKKNILDLAGKPLINYTVDSVLPLLKKNDEICVSTDSDEIKDIVEKNGVKVPFLRPNYLARDTSTTLDVINHAIDWYSKHNKFFDTLVLLQPTSPLRTSIHIKESLKLWSTEIDMIVSVKETDANPYYILFEEDKNLFLRKSKDGKFTRRQDCPKVYEYNGAIYVITIDSLKIKNFYNFDKIKKYLMLKESSIDIDDIVDFRLAELIIKNK